jgi:hypothetical protein
MSSLSTGSPPMVEEKLGWSTTIPGSCIKSAKRLHCNRLALWKDNPDLSSSPMSPRASPAGPVRWRPATRRPSSSPDEGCGSGRSAAPARTGARSARRAGRDRSVRLPGPTGDPDRRRPTEPSSTAFPLWGGSTRGHRRDPPRSDRTTALRAVREPDVAHMTGTCLARVRRGDGGVGWPSRGGRPERREGAIGPSRSALGPPPGRAWLRLLELIVELPKPRQGGRRPRSGG